MCNWFYLGRQSSAAIVGAAVVVCTVSTNGHAATLINFGDTANIGGAIFELVDPAVSGGSGTVRSFNRLQTQGNGTVEEGYNTSGGQEPSNNTNLTGNSTPVIVLEDPMTGTLGTDYNDIPIVDIGGTDYRSFILDLNEEGGSDASIDLVSLQLFQAATSDLDEGNQDTPLGMDGGDFGGAATLAYNLSEALEINIPSAGSGSWDVNIFIPDSNFSNIATNPYVYLYSKFEGASNGFEEWATVAGGAPTGIPIDPPTSVPTPALLPGLIGFGMSIVRKRKQQALA